MMSKRKRVPSQAKRTSENFLLEIGCEELPADCLPTLLDWERQGPMTGGGLASTAVGLFEGEGIVWETLQSFGTPRRLVLLAQGIEPQVKKREKGPPVSVAYDAQDKPTKAAEAFAARHGMKVSELKREDTPKGPVVFAEYSIPVIEVLSRAIPEIIQRIVLPKKMRWDESGAQFLRPIRWLLALYGSRVVPCTFGVVQSSNMTHGSRRLGGQPVRVAKSTDYFSKLPCLQVELEHGLVWKWKEDYLHEIEEPYPVKRQRLREQLEQTARRLGGRLPDQKTEEFGWLLNTAAFLAENPVIQAGEFQKEYLDLPAEVLATAMAKYLKLFSVVSTDGKRLLARFLAVLEGTSRRAPSVLANIERVLEARICDARFFFAEDTRTPLESKVPELKGLVFHEKLGTVAGRIPRLKLLMEAIASAARLPLEVSNLTQRAALLCKADLVTQMVREFPSLQGTMGGTYARRDGESEELAKALTEQYHPRTASEPVPSSALGAVLSLADRIDTLIGYFGFGLKPTGSADPYALRRQALGAVRILVEPPRGASFVGLSIDSLIQAGIESWGLTFPVGSKVIQEELRSFFKERFEWLAGTRERFERELIDAVLAAEKNDLAGAWERLLLLRSFWVDPRKKDVLLRAAKVAERTGRIVRSAKEDGSLQRVNPQALQEVSERRLWQAWSKVATTLSEQLKRRDYSRAIETYSSLYPEVHTFFEKVFVMDENPDVRRNRLAFLKEIYQSLAIPFADLSKLPLAGVEPS